MIHNSDFLGEQMNRKFEEKYIYFSSSSFFSKWTGFTIDLQQIYRYFGRQSKARGNLLKSAYISDNCTDLQASRRLIWIRSPDFETVRPCRTCVERATRNIERNVSKRKPAARSQWLERDGGTRCSSPFNAISGRQFVFEGNLIPRQLTRYYSKALILPLSLRAWR